MLWLRWLLPALLVLPLAMSAPHETVVVSGRAAVLVDEPRASAPEPTAPAPVPEDDGIGLVVSHLVQPPPGPPPRPTPESSYGAWPPPTPLEATAHDDTHAPGAEPPGVTPPENAGDPGSDAPDAEAPGGTDPAPPTSGEDAPEAEPPVATPGEDAPEAAPPVATPGEDPPEAGAPRSPCFLICLGVVDGWLW